MSLNWTAVKGALEAHKKDSYTGIFSIGGLSIVLPKSHSEMAFEWFARFGKLFSQDQFEDFEDQFQSARVAIEESIELGDAHTRYVISEFKTAFAKCWYLENKPVDLDDEDAKRPFFGLISREPFCLYYEVPSRTLTLLKYPPNWILT